VTDPSGPDSGSDPRPGSSSATDPVRAAAEASYRLLSPQAARLYRLMSLRSWPAFSPSTAASALGNETQHSEGAPGVDESAATGLIEELTAAHLLEHVGVGRYRYRPAVRAHAEALAVREDGLGACAAAVSRVVQGYLHQALRAAQAALPESWRVPPLPEELASGPHAPGVGRAEAVAQLTAELGNLVQALYAAEEFGDHSTVVLLGQAMWPLQLKAGRHDEVLPALRLAARTADAHLPGSRAAGALHAQLAHSLTELGRFEEAEPAARAAADREAAAGHLRGHASAIEFLGLLRLRQWRFAEAYDCFTQAMRRYADVDPESAEAADLPRARALLTRHQGRALRGLGQRADAQQRLHEALSFFETAGEAYNTARTLTDLAETLLDADETQAALPLIDRAMAALADEGAEYHLVYLRSLRQGCLSPESPAPPFEPQ